MNEEEFNENGGPQIAATLCISMFFGLIVYLLWPLAGRPWYINLLFTFFVSIGNVCAGVVCGLMAAAFYSWGAEEQVSLSEKRWMMTFWFVCLPFSIVTVIWGIAFRVLRGIR